MQHYKGYVKADGRREYLLGLTRKYMEIHTNADKETGEIYESNLPRVCTDERRAKRKAKEGNANSYASRLFDALKGNARFYTLILADIEQRLGDYDTPFSHKYMKEVKAIIDSIVTGPYMAKVELSAHAGAHIHVICKP